MHHAVLVAFHVAAAAEPWDFVRGAHVEPQPERTYVAGQPLRPMYGPGVLDEDLVREAARASAEAAAERLADGGAAPSPACGLGTPIELYVWPGERLPAERLFPRERWDETIVGVYLPGPVDRVALVPLPPRETYRILVHEFAHAWYERACAASILAESSEAFAQAVATRALAMRDATQDPQARPASVTLRTTQVTLEHVPSVLLVAPEQLVLTTPRRVVVLAPQPPTLVAVPCPRLLSADED